MAIAFKNHKEWAPGANGGTSAAVDMSGATFLVVVTAFDPAATITITDSLGSSYTNKTVYTSASHVRVQVAYAYNVTGGASMTFTSSTSFGYPASCAMGFSGILTTDPFDTENGNNVAGTPLATGSTGTLSQAVELAISGIAFDTSQTPAIDSSFNTPYTLGFSGGTNYGVSASYLIVAATTALNPSWSSFGSNPAAGDIATFKGAVGASTFIKDMIGFDFIPRKR